MCKYDLCNDTGIVNAVNKHDGTKRTFLCPCEKGHDAINAEYETPIKFWSSKLQLVWEVQS